MQRAHLSLVKSLSHLLEEQRYSDEICLDFAGLSLVRGTITEISGQPSSGKTSAALSLLAQLTSAGEICAVVDSCGGFDPESAFLAGIELENLLWTRCGGNVEKAFIAADYLVQAKGFGAIWLNLNGLATSQLRMVPKTYWYRYRTKIKETPTLLLVTARESVTGSASQQAFTSSREHAAWAGTGRYKLLSEFYLNLHSAREFYGRALPAKIEFDYNEV